jgi:N-methylhydantoinase A/oxoprolinase/acetone carboxylase beta subunit
VRSILPDVVVSLSSEVLPVFREYERSMTTVLNVQIMPVVSSYVARLNGRLADDGIAALAADEVERRRHRRREGATDAGRDLLSG